MTHPDVSSHVGELEEALERFRPWAATLAARSPRTCEVLGWLPHAATEALLGRAGLVVVPSRYEPFGMVPLEAMACGVPVVVSAVGALVDTVIDGTTGLHVPPRRPDVLANTLRELLADPTAGESYGIAGSDRARSRYAWQRIGRETLGIYQRVRADRAGQRLARSGA